MIERIVHSFEAGRRGKPDELDSIIANMIANLFMIKNNNARFDLDVSGDYSPADDKIIINIGGEISESLLQVPNLESSIAKGVVLIYNTTLGTRLIPDNFRINFNFKKQADVLASNGEAGDIGHCIAVAYRQAPNYEPWERWLAVELRNVIDYLQGHKLDGIVSKDRERFFGHLGRYYGLQGEKLKTFVSSKMREVPEYFIDGLRPDGKVSVEFLYDVTDIVGIRPIGIERITICAEHEPRLDVEELRNRLTQIVSHYINEVLALDLPLGFLRVGTSQIHVNPLGPWNVGGWRIDSGNREAKPYRDGFGSYGCCEDSFSGEDPTKPSGTGTFLARYIAVQVVGNDLANFARVALTYTAGSKDVGLNITTNGTGKLKQHDVETWVRNNIPLGINDAIIKFGLRNPRWYEIVAIDSDFFHNPHLPWNKFEVKYK